MKSITLEEIELIFQHFEKLDGSTGSSCIREETKQIRNILKQ